MSAAAASPATTSTTWNIDPVHSVAEFRVKHMMIANVRGRFTGVSGKLTYHSTDVAKSRVEASIDAATIDTRDPQRDTHLKGPDFFDVEKFPSLTYSSSRVTRRANGALHHRPQRIWPDLQCPSRSRRRPGRRRGPYHPGTRVRSGRLIRPSQFAPSSRESSGQ